MKKIGIVWVAAICVVSILLGALGGALLVTWKVIRFEADAVTHVAADATLNVASLLVMLDEEDFEKRIELFESLARSQTVVGVLNLHYNLQHLSEEKKQYVQSVLKGIATKRERLKIGNFADPPQAHIEEILKQYSE